MHLFVSCSEADLNQAKALCIRLKDSGFETWLYKDKLLPSVKWSEEIDEAIKNCSGIILLLSKASMNSPYVTYEWSYAMGLGKAIFPVLLENIDKHPKLSPIQHANFSNGNDEFDKLKTAIEQCSVNNSKKSIFDQLTEDDLKKISDWSDRNIVFGGVDSV
jgi:hypothetical protein